MNRKLIATFIVAFWFVLNGIDFLQDSGLIEYASTEMDRSIEDVVDNFGEAIRASAGALAGAVRSSSLIPYAFFYDLEEFPVHHRRIRANQTKIDRSVSHFQLHKFNEIFLI